MLLIRKYFGHARMLLVMVASTYLFCYGAWLLRDPVVYVIFGSAAVLMGIAATTLMVDMFSGRFSIQASKVGVGSIIGILGLMILAYFSVSKVGLITALICRRNVFRGRNTIRAYFISQMGSLVFVQIPGDISPLVTPRIVVTWLLSVTRS